MSKYNYNDPIPEGKDPILGLYKIGKEFEHRIIRRADKFTSGYEFVSQHGANAEYYVQPPIAWAPLPEV